MLQLDRKALLRKAVLSLVAQHEPISRKTLQKHLHVRLATLTEITRELIGDGLLVENGSIAEDGLKKALRINGEQFCALGVALVRGSVLSVLINLRGGGDRAREAACERANRPGRADGCHPEYR